MPRETGWAIVGEEVGLYVGWQQTRAGAIAEHVSCLYGTSPNAWGGKLDEDQKKAWAICKQSGDRAVKVKITY